MNLLNKLTIKNLKLNKKRTIVTIIGIMLSVALITAVATMYSSMIKSLINYEVYEKGNFHVAYYNVSSSEARAIKNIRGIEKTYLTEDIGYAKLESSKNEYKPYVFLKGFTKSALENLSVKLKDGRLPENENEIVIPTHLKTNGRVTMNIGDTITLDIGTRVSDGYELNQTNPYTGDEEIINTVEKTYTIVGIIERPATNIEGYTAPGYTFITYMDEENMTGNVDVFAKYTKDGSNNYLSITSAILGVDEGAFTKMYKYNLSGVSREELNDIYAELDKAKYEYNINTYLITLENNIFENDTVGVLGVVVIIVIVIIIVTSVFCIKNSFDISITEKIKQYGMLRSVGATKKQIRKNVFYEATILGIIGIPLGLACGLLASYILIIISNMYLKGMLTSGMKIVLSYSWIAFAIATILGFLTIYLSAFKSAIKASRVSPIDSIRNSSDIKIKAKKIKCPKIIKKLFKIGGEISYKNLKRNRKKYRTTVVSIIMSVAVFIGLSYFTNSIFKYIDKEIGVSDYNIALNSSNNDTVSVNKFIETTTLDNIEEYTILKETSINIKTVRERYNKEYFDIIFGVVDNLDNVDYEDDTILVYIINDEQFKKYVETLGLDYEEVKDKAILNDWTKIYDLNEKEETVQKYNYKSGDLINGIIDSGEVTFEIACVTNKQPFGLNNTYNYNGELILSSRYYNDITKNNTTIIYYNSTNPNKLQDDIDNLLTGETYNLTNIEEQARMLRNVYTLVSIFLYGFIIVVSLIGVTNIFNTITTNMELRKQEFAMLKSVGMTKKEFSSMIRLESIFIGIKALIIGIPLGIAISYGIYRAMIETNIGAFQIPILAIVISIIVVYLLITILMKYSMNKINKQNIIETIRNENI